MRAGEGIRGLVAVALLWVLALAGPGWAGDIGALSRALQLERIAQTLHDEGQSYGARLDREMLLGQGGADWRATVDRIYDTGRIHRALREGLARRLDPGQMSRLAAYYGSEKGRRIVDLELAARKALRDPALEETALQEVTRARATGVNAGRDALIARFLSDTDLVDRNLAGSQNAMYQFYAGLVDSAVLALSETEILDEIRSGAEETRQETEEWLWAFLSLAYGPLTDQALADHVAHSTGPDGQALTAALFDAYDDTYRVISRALGLAVGRRLAQTDL